MSGGTAGMDEQQRGSVLIVDDTPANLRLLADTLGEHGFATRAALSGPLAIQAAQAQAPDLILLDIGMPDMDGFQVCERLKADPALKDVPVIFISALDETMDKVRAFAVGGVDYVTKPFQFEEVLARVETHLRLSRALEAEREVAILRARFISMASHEFRTPLTTILSSSEMLEHYGDEWSAEKRLAHLKRIQASVKTMMVLLEDVLLLGRATAGKIAFTPAQTDLAALCRDVADEVDLCSGRTHEIVLELECEPTVLIDERLVREVIENLVSNAVKYSAQGSRVLVRLTCPGDTARIEVSDSGIGVPQGDVAHLFEAFHRGGNVGATPGTGLGLAVVRQAVDLHGGTVEIESEVGAGTKVTVVLPAVG